MQADVTFEIKDKIIQWQITINMDIDWFLRIAKQVHEGYSGKRLEGHELLEEVKK